MEKSRSFTVNFKNWINNYPDTIETEEYSTLEEAIARAKEMNSVKTDYLGNNNYVTSGLETWVTDETGEVVW